MKKCGGPQNYRGKFSALLKTQSINDDDSNDVRGAMGAIYRHETVILQNII
jgi:hypothetical protein